MKGREKRDEAVQRICIIGEVRLKCNITPLSGLMSTAMSLVPVNKDSKLGVIDQLNMLVNVGSHHASGTAP